MELLLIGAGITTDAADSSVLSRLPQALDVTLTIGPGSKTVLLSRDELEIVCQRLGNSRMYCDNTLIVAFNVLLSMFVSMDAVFAEHFDARVINPYAMRQVVLGSIDMRATQRYVSTGTLTMGIINVGMHWVVATCQRSAAPSAAQLTMTVYDSIGQAGQLQWQGRWNGSTVDCHEQPSSLMRPPLSALLKFAADAWELPAGQQVAVVYHQLAQQDLVTDNWSCGRWAVVNLATVLWNSVPRERGSTFAAHRDQQAVLQKCRRLMHLGMCVPVEYVID
jgi:hypothetical protein